MPTARTRRVPRRFLSTGLAALLTTTGALAITGQPAAAGVTRWVVPTSTSYTDARQPAQAFPVAAGESLPLGTWEADGAKHTSRSYFTFDLTPYPGKEIISAELRTGEARVDDCTKPREVELWRTDTPEAAPTWANAPAVHEKIGDLGATATPCPAGYLELLVTEAVQRAVNEGRDSLTLMARIAGDHEQAKHYSRWIERPGISLDANAAPNMPGKLTVHELTCADGLLIGTTTPILSAEVTDPDKVDGYAGDLVSTTFAWWPVDRPTERTEWTSYSKSAPARFSYSVPAGLMVNNGTYAFAVKAADQRASSDWSPECRFTVDTEAPAQPTVTSTDYPDDDGWYGGPGIPGEFTFTANDGTDSVGFRYSLMGALPTYVAADAPGGSATVTITPGKNGPNLLDVEAVDATGNRSPVTRYVFRVRDTSPTITDGNPTAGYGEPRTLTFSPRMENVVEYTYRLNDGPEQTAAAAADGTSTITITPTKPGNNDVYVRSRTADGLLSGEGSYRFNLASKPTVTSVEYPMGKTGAPAGTPGTFVFGPGMPGVAEYVYSFDGRPTETVAAGVDGSASVTYTPTTAGPHRITVYTRTGDGLVSETFTGSFLVARAA
ncbi:DNRLRE domain-containing protein [Micromonospora eburnea]|uniref:DNRLRE domain-containing protein n=1 Tax=Micromonospora eburnea TaxID=227316 RepID=UPI000B856E56|nr:DNRLRE domain-containing protein [Micromonospora eburnea]